MKLKHFEKHEEISKTTCGLKTEPQKQPEPHTIDTNTSIPKKTQIFGCQFCNKKYKRKGSLRIHAKIHTREKEFTAKYLAEYMNVHGSAKVKNDANATVNKLETATEMNEIESDDEGAEILQKIKCENEQKIEESNDEIQHKTQITDILDGFNSNALTDSNKVNANGLDGSQPFACTVANCNKKYASRFGLVYHRRAHNNEKPFRCLNCNKCFRSKMNLKQHFMVAHIFQKTALQTKRENEKERIEVINIDQKPKNESYDSSFVIEKHETCIKKKTITKEEAHVTEQNKRHIFNNYSSDCNSSASSSIDDNRIPSTKRHSNFKYECSWDNCSKKFVWYSSFKNHMFIHNNEKPFKCAFSDTNSRGQDNLKRHMMRERKQKFKCHRCRTYLLTESALINHLRKKHQLEPAQSNSCQCPSCGRRFQFNSSFKLHMNMINKLTNDCVNCHLCKATFYSKACLGHHLRVNHSDNNKTKMETRLFVKNRYDCEYCYASFTDKSRLKIHMRVHTGFHCSKCYKKFTYKFGFMNHLCVPVKFESKVSDKSSYKNPYKCVECGYECISESAWMKHTKPDLTKELKSCEICKQQYTRRACLQRHIRRKSHYKKKRIDKSQQCKLCNFKFQSTYFLKVHMITHTGEKPYECSECHTKFKTYYKLEGHKLTHKQTCKICNKTLVKEETLKMHMRTQHPYCHICTKCNKIFKKKHNLKKHLLVHTKIGLKDQNRFQCKICKKQFRDSRKLNRHIVIHTREKQYECSECDKKYPWKSSLRRHIARHHKRLVPKKTASETINESSNILKLSERSSNKSVNKETKSQQTNNSQNDLIDQIRNVNIHLAYKKNDLVEKATVEHIKPEKAVKIETDAVVNKCYDCEYCKISFLDECSLKIHMRKHTGETPFQCAKCFKKFTYKFGFMRHLCVPVSSELKELSESSSKMSDSYNIQDDLIDQIKEKNLHLTDEKDDVVKIAKVEQIKAEEEVKVKTNAVVNELYDCEYCKTSFLDKCTLKIHMRKHTGETPFQCAKCFKKFTYKFGFMRHLCIPVTSELKKLSESSSKMSTTYIDLTDEENDLMEINTVKLEEVPHGDNTITSEPPDKCYDESICKEEIIIFD